MSDVNHETPDGVDPGDRTGGGREAPGYEVWTVRGIFRDYWRVVVIGGLAAIVAFVGSFVVAPTYGAGTRLLIRGRDTTVLNSTGAALGSQPGVIDSQLAAALSQTQAALLQTRDVAERVVDELDLDQKPPKTDGIIGKVRKMFSNVYKRTRAILTHGFYKEPERREGAIQAVYAGLGAKQVEDSYVLEVAATAEGPKLAAAIANTAADVLVDLSNERFRTESQAYRDFLRKQVDRAVKDERRASNAVAKFKDERGIVSSPEDDYLLTAESEDTIRAELRSAEAELDEARATVASLQSDVAGTSPFSTTNQQITTGRSETQVDTTGNNPVYAQLLGQLQQAQARAEGLAARVGALRGALESSAGVAEAGSVSQEEAQLSRLEFNRAIASSTLQTLEESYQASVVNAQRSAVEITRLDEAGVPTYPIGPKRYLYLAIGLLIGALVGFVWSFLKVQRRNLLPAGLGGAGSEQEGEGVPEVEEIDLTAAEHPSRAPATTAPLAGSGHHEDEDPAL